MSKRVDTKCSCGHDHINATGMCTSCQIQRYNQANESDYFFLAAMFPTLYDWREERIDAINPDATVYAEPLDEPFTPPIDEGGESWDFGNDEFDEPGGGDFDGDFGDFGGGWDYD